MGSVLQVDMGPTRPIYDQDVRDTDMAFSLQVAI